MTLLQPMMLWSLAALVPLAAFYFLKVRPRRKPTTALFLWEKVWEERRSNSLLHRLRDFWSLLLMALACAAICMALTRPEWTDRRQDLLILIDNSASMAAREGGSSRLDKAKSMAIEIVEGLNGTQRAAVATIAKDMVYRSHLTDNPRELIEAIESVTPSNQEFRAGALPDRKDSHNEYARDHRVLLLSDGSLGMKELPQPIELIKVGGAAENVGIVAADMDYLPGKPDQLGLYFQIASSYDKPREMDLIVARLDDRGNEEVMRVLPLEVKPGINPSETFTIENARPGKWIARLDGEDALAADDTAYLVARRPDPIRVAVQSKDRFFLEKSVLAFSRKDGLLTLVQERPDVVLSNKTPPNEDAGSHVKMLLFQPEGKSCWWQEIGEEIEVGTPRVMVNDHPALRYLDATTIPFVGARKITPAPGAQILVADERGIPLIYKARSGHREAIIMNLDPIASDFYFSAWLPVLVHSVSCHLVGRENPLSATYRPGDVAPIPGAAEETASKWEPVGKEGDEEMDEETIEKKAKTLRGRWVSLGDRLGYSQLSNHTGRWTLGCSLLSTSETMLNNKEAESTNEALSRGRSPAQWFTFLAIVVLVAESVLYHRRKVG